MTHFNISFFRRSRRYPNTNAREGEYVAITALPLHHISARPVNGLLYMRPGGRSVPITHPRDMPGFLKTLKGKQPDPPS